MQRIISIVGPTASGKSKKALGTAHELLRSQQASEVVILSADSKQVYSAIPILSGADIPDTFVPAENTVAGYRYYVDTTVSQGMLAYVGVSIIEQDRIWSVAEFQSLAQAVFAKFPNAVVIVEGGTGLYHSFVCRKEAFVAPDTDLRERLRLLSLEELQQQAAAVDEVSYTALNNSDRNNSRRLIRVIERSQGVHADRTDSSLGVHEHECEYDHTWIFVDTDMEVLQEKITKRVRERIAAGVYAEVSAVLETEQKGLPVADTLRATIGFTDIEAELAGRLSHEECLEHWIRAELQYAKRQATWFKKVARNLANNSDLENRQT